MYLDLSLLFQDESFASACNLSQQNSGIRFIKLESKTLFFFHLHIKTFVSVCLLIESSFDNLWMYSLYVNITHILKRSRIMMMITDKSTCHSNEPYKWHKP